MLKSLPTQNFVEVEERKKKEEFRNYTDSLRNDLVNYTYLQNHMNQTVHFVESMRAEYSKFQVYTNLCNVSFRLITDTLIRKRK